MAEAVMGEFEEWEKEWNHFQDNLLDLEGKGKWEKERGIQWEWEKEMKYHWGLNNVRPSGKCSPRAALTAFISISFMASSLLSCRAMGTDPADRSSK